MSDELRQKILVAYEEAVLTSGTVPASVFAFCKERGIRERDFFDRFSSFPQVERALWESWVSEAIGTVDGDAEASGYSARERYLAFLFTFVEVMKDHRSWILSRFPGLPKALGCEGFAGMRDAFGAFANGLDVRLPVEEVSGRFAPSDWRAKILYPHFLGVIDFFRNDVSEGFSRTDAFIEKSVRAAFEVLDGGVVEAGLDLFRFLAGNRKGV